MNTNAFGAIRVTQAFLPLLEKATAARVINVSSGYGEINSLSAEVPSYCLSKLTLNGATIMLADIWQPKGIAVYAMCPGWVKTDMGGSTAPRSPEQGADTAIWLATEASPSLSGKFFRDSQEISYCVDLIKEPTMSEHNFHDEISIAEEAEKWAKKAMELKLIPGFIIHFYPDSWQFYIANEPKSEPLTPEEAYFYFKKLVEKSN